MGAAAEHEIDWGPAAEREDDGAISDDGGALALADEAREAAARSAWSCWAAAGSCVAAGHGAAGYPAGYPTVAAEAVGAAEPDDVVRALADVVGSEPGPRNVRAPYRTPMPGLGPLDGFGRALRGYAMRLRAHGVPPEAVVVHVKRLVRDALPSGTPEWSAHLLTEQVVRWATSVQDAAA